MRHILFLFATLFLSFNVYCQSYDDLGKLYANGKREEVLELGKKYLKTDSNSTELNMLVGRTLVELNQYKESIPYLEKGIIEENSKDYIRAWSLAYLGTAYYMTDDFEKSKDALRKCIKINATKNATTSSEKKLKSFLMDDYFDSWEILETEHFRFHIQDKKVLGNVNEYIKRRETAYLNINKFFNAEPFKKIDFFIWSSRKNMKKRFGKESGFANSNVCMINVNYDQTPGHEIVHILSFHGIKHLKTTRLINEGIAVYFDQTNRNRMKVAKDDTKGATINLIELWNSPEKYPETYMYTVSGAFIEFLMKKGSEERIKQLLKEQTVENAKKIYDNFDDLVKEFEQKLKI